MGPVEGDPEETKLLLESAGREDGRKLLADLFMRHRERLRLLAQLRMDPRLQARVDPSDVLQEAFLEACKRIEGYLRAPPMALFLWFRKIAGQKLVDLHRFHLGARVRDARREVPIHEVSGPEATSVALASRLVGKDTSPSHEAIRKELESRVRETLDRMDPIDREVLSLRHFERLSNVEAA